MRCFVFCFLMLCSHTSIAQKRSHWMPMLRAQIAIKKGKYKKAHPLTDKAFENFSKKKERESWIYAEYCNSIGYAYMRLGESKRALELWQKGAKLLISKKRPNQRFVARYYNNLGAAYDAMGEYQQAINLYNEVLPIIHEKFNSTNRNVANIYTNLGLIYSNTGNYDKAINLHNKGLGIRIIKLGNKHRHVANSYNNLGVIYNAKGDFDKAINLHNKALKIQEKPKRLRRDLATSYSNLGDVHYKIGDFEKANLLHKKALIIREKELRKGHIELASTFHNLATYHYYKNNFEEAIDFYNRTINIMENKLGNGHPFIATSLHNLASVYYLKGDFQEAINLHNEALTIQQSTLGNQHLYIALTYNGLAVIYDKMNNHEKSINLYKKSLSTFTKKLREESPYVSIIRSNLANKYYRIGQCSRADSLWTMVIPSSIKLLNSAYSFLSDRQRTEYLENIGVRYETFYSFVSTYKNDSTRHLATNLLLNTKSLALDYAVSTNQLIEKINAPELNAQYEKLNILNKQLSDIEIISPQELEKRAWDIPKIQEEQEDLSFQILQHPQLKSKLNTKTIAWQDIQDSLAINEATIDFLRVYENKDSLWAYYGIVISKALSSPQFVRLTEEDTLNKYVVDTLTGKPHYLSHSDRLFELYQQVWQPLEPHLEGITKVHLSPSGALHKISFEALKYNLAGSDLAGRYDFHYYSALRDMLKEKTETPDYKDIVLGGDIIYDLDQEGERLKNEEKILGIAAVNRGSRNGFKYLPNTLSEIIGVRKIAKKSGLNTTLLTGAAVTEDTVQHFSGELAPSILHWATHGDFLTRPDSMPKHPSIGSYHRLRVSDNPLQRSLLAFYGANYRWKQNERRLYSDDDDGILTALEVTALDLQNTSLVVLSACSTGLGDTHDTEGVFGLQRAFKLAGVDYVVASLWQVDDAATKDLMVEFYQNLLEKKQSPADALRNAKAGFMKNDVDPELWAGFILIE